MPNNKCILVSKCLLGYPCRYDGKDNKDDKVIDYIRGMEVYPFCPEQEGGLSTPRDPSEIISDVDELAVISDKGNDVTEYFVSGAERCLAVVRDKGIMEALLKESSPSCGVHKVYDGTFSGTKIEGMGVTARLLKENGITLKSEKDL